MSNKYIEEEQTKLFNELGVFFAFSTGQFEEQKKEGIKYCSVLGSGDCVPVDNVKTFCERLSKIQKKGNEIRLAEKGIDKIIEDELVNHECYYTNDTTDIVNVLACYNVTHEQVNDIFKKTYLKHCDN